MVDYTSDACILLWFDWIPAQPAFNVKPQDQKVGLNGIASFDCQAAGNPSPSTFFHKEGKKEFLPPRESNWKRKRHNTQ